MIEELGGAKALPIPNSFPQQAQYKEFDYAFISPGINEAATPAQSRWTHGESLDDKGEFHVRKAQPYGDEPKLGAPDPKGHAQKEQMSLIDNVLGNIKDTLAG